MEHNQELDNDGTMKPKANVALIIFLIIDAFFLITEHRAHIVRWLPFFTIFTIASLSFNTLFHALEA